MAAVVIVAHTGHTAHTGHPARIDHTAPTDLAHIEPTGVCVSDDVLLLL